MTNSLPVNTFKRALAKQRRQLGLWVNFAYAPIVEALAGSGFDWLLFDMEHTPNDLETVGQQLLALRGAAVAPIVRVPIHDMAWIKREPMTAEEAAKAAAAQAGPGAPAGAAPKAGAKADAKAPAGDKK